MAYFQSEMPIAVMLIAPLSSSVRAISVLLSSYGPRMTTLELLAQVCNQTSENPKNQIMFFTLLGLYRINCCCIADFRLMNLDGLQRHSVLEFSERWSHFFNMVVFQVGKFGTASEKPLGMGAEALQYIV